MARSGRKVIARYSISTVRKLQGGYKGLVCLGSRPRKRAFMDGPDELVIITDVLPHGATEHIRLGEWRNQRRL